MNSLQMKDQAAKGSLLGLITYLALKWDLDPELVAICTPFLAWGLAWLSTRIGDPELASFLDGNTVQQKKKRPAKRRK